MSQQDNVLVFKPDMTGSASEETRNNNANQQVESSSVIFLKPEIDRNMLHFDESGSVFDTFGSSQASSSAHEDSKSNKQRK